MMKERCAPREGANVDIHSCKQYTTLALTVVQVSFQAVRQEASESGRGVVSSYGDVLCVPHPKNQSTSVVQFVFEGGTMIQPCTWLVGFKAEYWGFSYWPSKIKHHKM